MRGECDYIKIETADYDDVLLMKWTEPIQFGKICDWTHKYLINSVQIRCVYSLV